MGKSRGQKQAAKAANAKAEAVAKAKAATAKASAAAVAKAKAAQRLTEQAAKRLTQQNLVLLPLRAQSCAPVLSKRLGDFASPVTSPITPMTPLAPPSRKKDSPQDWSEVEIAGVGGVGSNCYSNSLTLPGSGGSGKPDIKRVTAFNRDISSPNTDKQNEQTSNPRSKSLVLQSKYRKTPNPPLSFPLGRGLISVPTGPQFSTGKPRRALHGTLLLQSPRKKRTVASSQKNLQHTAMENNNTARSNDGSHPAAASSASGAASSALVVEGAHQKTVSPTAVVGLQQSAAIIMAEVEGAEVLAPRKFLHEFDESEALGRLNWLIDQEGFESDEVLLMLEMSEGNFTLTEKLLKAQGKQGVKESESPEKENENGGEDLSGGNGGLSYAYPKTRVISDWKSHNKTRNEQTSVPMNNDADNNSTPFGARGDIPELFLPTFAQSQQALSHGLQTQILSATPAGREILKNALLSYSLLTPFAGPEPDRDATLNTDTLHSPRSSGSGVTKGSQRTSRSEIQRLFEKREKEKEEAAVTERIRQQRIPGESNFAPTGAAQMQSGEVLVEEMQETAGRDPSKGDGWAPEDVAEIGRINALLNSAGGESPKDSVELPSIQRVLDEAKKRLELLEAAQRKNSNTAAGKVTAEAAATAGPKTTALVSGVPEFKSLRFAPEHFPFGVLRAGDASGKNVSSRPDFLPSPLSSPDARSVIERPNHLPWQSPYSASPGKKNARGHTVKAGEGRVKRLVEVKEEVGAPKLASASAKPESPFPGGGVPKQGFLAHAIREEEREGKKGKGKGKKGQNALENKVVDPVENDAVDNDIVDNNALDNEMDRLLGKLDGKNKPSADAKRSSKSASRRASNSSTSSDTKFLTTAARVTAVATMTTVAAGTTISNAIAKSTAAATVLSSASRFLSSWNLEHYLLVGYIFLGYFWGEIAVGVRAEEGSEQDHARAKENTQIHYDSPAEELELSGLQAGIILSASVAILLLVVVVIRMRQIEAFERRRRQE